MSKLRAPDLACPEAPPARPQHRAPLLVLALIALLGPSVALAQTGVSDDRVSLPEGPGSVDGFSDNTTVQGNMGMLQHSVSIEVPSGYAGMTPQLSLSYSSGTGNTPLGMGWDLPVSSIERTTIRGLPRYTADDEFAADGSMQLVQVEASGTPTYRTRFEKGFVRYRWHERDTGLAGYWTAEYPDGTVGYFGADRDGNLVDSARSQNPGTGATFRYYLHQKVDPFGHVLQYNYTLSTGPGGRQPILSSVHYGPMEDGRRRYRVELTYQDRDDLILDCKPGFCEQIADRLRLVDIFVGDDAIRRYELTYEQAGGAGLSRLTKVVRKGSDGSTFPAEFTFDYSRSIGEQCSGCEMPYLVDMARQGVGVDIGQGYATLLDINGDALPDLVDTRSGNHTFYLNELGADGSQTFADGYTSQVSEQSGFELNNPNTQALDVDGDGFVDVVNRLTQHYLRNLGEGDWASYEAIASGSTTPDFSVDFDPGESRLTHVRFLDYDNDKRIDIIRSLDAGGVTMYRNTSAGLYEVDGDAADIGYGFDGGGLQFSDMNGDGLLDPVRVLAGRIEFRLNLGYAQWGDWQGTDLDIATSEVPLVELEDLNGDELSDVVIVQNDVLRYALNRNGSTFDDWVTLSDVDGKALPTRGPNTAVLYADMNANGSTDILWADSSGVLTYLELFPVRPNLLNLIENGLGGVTTVRYGTSAEHLARAGGAGAWQHKLSHAMVVVDELDQWEELGNEHEARSFQYADGYYDGVEKRFFGFANVSEALAEDDAQQGGRTDSVFSVGADDPYFAGKLTADQTFALVDGDARPLQATAYTYEECPLSNAESMGGYEVRHICETRTRLTVQEGAPESDHVVIETRKEYDGYGRVTTQAELGVVGTGADGDGECAACTRGNGEFGAACGGECLGDERYTETRYIAPGDKTGGAWFLDKVSRVRVRGAEGDDGYSEELTYYDGPAFVGLPAGELEKGLVARVTHRVDRDGASVTSERNRYDSHGNLVESIDPNGLVDGDDHRRVWTYEETGLRIVETEIKTTDAGDGAYSLVREYGYDPLWDKPVEATAWMVRKGGEILSNRNSEYYGYDVFGRTAFRVLRGGDSVDSPTEDYTYALSSPVSRVRTRRRSQVGGDYDLETIRCIDGRGRQVQTKIRLASGKYQTSGFTTYNSRSSQTRVYQPYVSDNGDCDERPPSGALYAQYRYDGTGRLLETIEPDAALHGSASTTKTVYSPLQAVSYDEEDTDGDSDHADTPTVTITDGLGRTVALRRRLSAEDDYSDLELYYDALGHMSGYRDAGGDQKAILNDLLGRTVQIEDPNAGRIRMTYDDAGNLLSREDARGVVVKTTYEGANRKRSQYEEGERDATLIEWTYDFAEDCDECDNAEGMVARVSFPGRGSARDRDEFGYDPRSHLVFMRRTLDGHAFVTERKLDNADRLYETVFPDGATQTRTYDGASRTTAISGLVAEVTYGERGELTGLTLADGTTHEQTFNERLQLASRKLIDPDGNVLQGAELTRDRVGNLIGAEDLADAREDAAGWQAGYSYDAWYRLASAEYGTGDDGYRADYTFDAQDNLTNVAYSRGQDAVLNGTYEYAGDRPNALTSGPGGLSLDYDAAGSVVRRRDTGFEWDHLGRLVGVTDGDHTPTAMRYGGDEERVVQTVRGGHVYYISPDFEVRDGVGISYARIGKELVARSQSLSLASELLDDLAPEGDPDGEVHASDAYLAAAGGDSDVGGHLRAAARRLLVRSEPVFLHEDHKGDVTLATHEGAVIGEQAFYPTGRVREQHGFVDVRGFAGQEQDEASGLLHHRFRYLDPDTGRWLSADPAFLQADPKAMAQLGESTTAYAYVGNRFVNHDDPTGLRGERIKAALGAAKNAAGRGLRAAGRGLLAAGRKLRAAGGAIKRAPGRFARWTKTNRLARSIRNRRAAARRPQFVYRYDGRTPQEMAQHGMRPYNEHANRPLMDHVRQNDYASQWTSTSRDVKIPGIMPVGKYVYRIRLPDNGIDVNTHFANHAENNPYAAQREYAVPGTIPSANIVGFMTEQQFVQGLANNDNFQFQNMPP